MGKITIKHYLNKQLKPEKVGTELYYPLYVSITVKSKNIKRRSYIIAFYGESEKEFISEKEFKKGFPNQVEIRRCIEYEENLIYRITKLFMQDVENKTIKKEKLYLFLTRYNSKDDFLNMLNAYIDFYSHSIYEAISNYCTNEIENEIYNKLAIAFNLPSPEEAKNIFEYQSQYESPEFIYNNLSMHSVELLVLRERLRSFLSPYCIKTGRDIPYIDWIDNLIQSDLREFLKTYQRKSEYYLLNGFIIDNTLIDKYINIVDAVVNSPDYIKTKISRREINFKE